MFQDMLISVCDRKTFYVENYISILDFREDLILLKGKKGNIRVEGSGFSIDYFTKESMKVRGSVSIIEFERI